MLKQSLIFLLICIAYWSVEAQQSFKEVKIGTASDFFSQLKYSSGNNAKAQSLKHSLGVGASVQYSVKEFSSDASVTKFSGKVTGSASSNVRITVSDGVVEGTVILPDKKKSYEYVTRDGNVFLKETDIHETVCVDIKQKKSASATSTKAGVVDLFNMQSKPGSEFVVYLDFDGEYVVSSWWNGGQPIDAARSWYNEDDILHAYTLVVEDFAAYDLNITTSRAVYNAAAAGKKNMVVFTSTTTASPGSGGVAYIGVFSNTDFVPCWVFNGGGKAGGETASHEIGHVMGLLHDGYSSPYGEYASGHNGWAPIMGVSFFDGYMGTWSKGEYVNANNTTQDDVEVIGTQNGFGFRLDEASANINVSTPQLSYSETGVVAAANNKYVITKSSDQDVFRFQTTGGITSLTARPADSLVTPSGTYPIANLDIQFTLLNSGGTVLETSNPAGLLSASFTRNLSAGTYYVKIDGVGKGDPATNGYSDFSSIGAYTVSGTIQGSYQNDFSVGILTPAANGNILMPGTFTLTSAAVSRPTPITKVEYYEGATKIGESTVSPYSVSWNTVPEGTHTIFAKAYNGAGQTTNSVAVTFNVYYKLTPETYSNFVYGGIYEYHEGSYSTLPNFNNITPLYRGITTNFSLTELPHRADNFAVTFKGYLYVHEDGLYKLSINSDDGSRIYVGNRLVVNNDGLHPAQQLSGYVALSAGYHAIKVDYFEAAGQEVLELALFNETMGQPRYFSLYHKDTNVYYPPYIATKILQGVKYEYNEGIYSSLPDFNTLTYLREGAMSKVDIAVPGRRADNFAVRFTAYVQIPYAGEYTFYTNSDDGSKLYINNLLVVNNDGLHPTVEQSGKIWLYPGKHAIRVEYFEAQGSEVIRASYAGPGIPKIEIQPNVLWHDPARGEQTSYYETPFSIPGYLNAEYYDHGGEGYAYHDKTPGNQFGFFRTTESVDLQRYSSYYTDYSIASIQDGEWVEYTVNVSASRNYDVYFTTSAGDGSSKLHLEVDGVTIPGLVNIPTGTSGWQTVALNNIPLTQGQRVLRVYFDQGGFELNNISFSEVPFCSFGTTNYNYNITPYSNQLRASFTSNVNSSYVTFHYKINGAGQLNYYMNKNGNNFTWTINNVNANDIVEYFFVYNYQGTGVQYETTRTTWTVGQYCYASSRTGDGEPEVVNTSFDETAALVYPNPFHTELNIDLSAYKEVGSVKLLNMTGHKEWEAQVNGAGRLIHCTKELPAGIYLLEWNSGEKVMRTRVVKVE